MILTAFLKDGMASRRIMVAASLLVPVAVSAQDEGQRYWCRS